MNLACRRIKKLRFDRFFSVKQQDCSMDYRLQQYYNGGYNPPPYPSPNDSLRNQERTTGFRAYVYAFLLLILGAAVVAATYSVMTRDAVGDDLVLDHASLKHLKKVEYYLNITTLLILNDTNSINNIIIPTLRTIEFVINNTVVVAIQQLSADLSSVYVQLANQLAVVIEYLTTIMGRPDLPINCDDGNDCTVNIPHSSPTFGFVYCTHEHAPQGTSCADQCFEGEIGTCSVGTCTGTCKGTCPFNYYSDLGLMTQTPGCNHSNIVISDFYSNNTILSPGANVRLTTYAGNDSRVTSAICLAQACYWRVVIMDPKEFLFGVGDNSNSTTDSIADQVIYDRLCQGILSPLTPFYGCIDGHYSTMSYASSGEHSCIYYYKCSAPKAPIDPSNPNYRGR